MQTNMIQNSRTPIGQINWSKWEDRIIAQCAGKIPKEQISNILNFVDSNRARSVDAIVIRAAKLGWKLKIKKVK